MAKNKGIQHRPARAVESRWIVGTVAFLSILLFALLGGQVLPAAVAAALGTSTNYPMPTVPFILSIALTLLAWRRSTELKNAARAKAEADARAYSLAYSDDVTNLFNRRYFTEAVRACSPEQQHALIMLDLDHFKKVNDLYGHAAGDCLLLKLSERMRAVVPDGACCARLGGDEFAILISGASATCENVSTVAQRLLDEISTPVRLEASVACVSASVGLSTLTAGQRGAEVLLRRSDIAMYEAKRKGRNCYIWFDTAMEKQLNERNRLEAEMRSSIVEGRFLPYFQPMLDLASGEVNGFEVLARWDHPIRGIVEPDDFIPIAEATGIISDLTLSVMKAALLRALAWPRNLTIAVNISPIQFKDPLLSQRIIKLLTETGFPASRLELEITESAILEDRDMALSTVQSLKNFGVRISLDDFGTGYASLSQLRELPFDRIKIDKSFVATLLDDKQSNAIVHAIATLGRSLELPITAEGVESETVHQRLQELGCSDAQGWLFGRAISGQETGQTFFDLPADEKTAPVDYSSDRLTHDRRGFGRRGAN